MTWYDVEKILIEGNEEKIKEVRCPDCGGHLEYRYSEDEKGRGAIRIYCDSCCMMENLYGVVSEPNCVKYMGASSKI